MKRTNQETWDGMGRTEESDLVERAGAGDAAAYDDLVRLHYARVHATAFHLVGNPEDAEDVTQECFVKAHQGLAWYRGDGAFAGWLRRILVHLVRDRFRRRARRPLDEPLPGEIIGEVIGERAGPEQTLGDRELALLVAEAIERLPEALRIAFVLRTREGLTYDEISGAAGVTPATARTQVMKARRALARRLGKHFDGGGDR